MRTQRTQKELKEVYRNCVEDIWSDKGMIDYSMKNIGYIVEFSNGNIAEIEKPTIKKDFCFSHGYCGVSTDEDEERANRCVEIASSDENYFYNENMKELYETIENLEKSKQRDNIYMCQAYCGQSEDNILRAYTCKNMYNEHKLNEEDKLSPEDIDRIIEGYREVIKNFDKRLKTYLKKYGLSKVKAWSYLSD